MTVISTLLARLGTRFSSDGFNKVIFKRAPGTGLVDSKRNALAYVRCFPAISSK